MPSRPGVSYTFGSYMLDPASRALRRSGIAVTLPPKTFDLLVFMAESGGRLLTERELMDTLWNGTFVEESNLSFQISTLRKLLGKEGSAWIEVVPKYGYRFRVPVEKYAAPENVQAAAIRQRPVEQEAGRTASLARRIWLIAAVAGLLAIAAGLATWIRWPKNRNQRADTAMRVIPATTQAAK